MPPPRATLLDQASRSKLADFFIQRGGKKTGFWLALAATLKVALGVIHRDIDEIVTGFFYEALVMAYLSLFFTGKRTTDMVATGIGEIKKESPNLENRSADPAIDRVIAKIENGSSPVGTSTGKVDLRGEARE